MLREQIRLVRIYLDENNIGHMDNTTFKNLHSLKLLSLANNRLETFNLNGTELRSLEFLDLRNNKLNLRKAVFPMLRNIIEV